MKFRLINIFVIAAVGVGNIFAQWEPDIRLTNDPAVSYTSINNAWCIASSGNVVQVVWYDFRDGNSEIYYKRSTDGGVSWGADTRLTNNSANSLLPSVSVSTSVVHVVWRDLRDGNDEIYYKRSTDGGVSWGADTRLTNNSAVSYNPSVSVSGSAVHVVWSDLRDGNFEIYYKRSTDGGISWGADTRLTNNSTFSEFPSVSVSGSFVHVVWLDFRDGNFEIYYKRSTDGGVSWGADTRLTNNSANSRHPSVSVSGSAVHVVWWDDRDGNPEIYHKGSTDGGSSWGAETPLTNNSATSANPFVSVSGSVVHVVWYDNRDGNDEIYYKRDPTGNPTGVININSEIPKEFSLSQNYPNPFNPSTTIQFSIQEQSFVKLEIFNALGEKVSTLVSENLSTGTYEYEWNAEGLPSGVYFYRLTAENYTQVKKLLFMK